MSFLQIEKCQYLLMAWDCKGKRGPTSWRTSEKSAAWQADTQDSLACCSVSSERWSHARRSSGLLCRPCLPDKWSCGWGHSWSSCSRGGYTASVLWSTCGHGGATPAAAGSASASPCQISAGRLAVVACPLLAHSHSQTADTSCLRTGQASLLQPCGWYLSCRLGSLTSAAATCLCNIYRRCGHS